MSLVRFRPEAPLICGFSSFGRAPPCQGGGGGFEPRNPLQKTRSKGRVFSFERIGASYPPRTAMAVLRVLSRPLMCRKASARNTCLAFLATRDIASEKTVINCFHLALPVIPKTPRTMFSEFFIQTAGLAYHQSHRGWISSITASRYCISSRHSRVYLLCGLMICNAMHW